MIKLLAIDMDETAVNSRHRMTKATKEALKEVYAKGIQVVPVTGRCLEGLPTGLRGIKELLILSLRMAQKSMTGKKKECYIEN